MTNELDNLKRLNRQLIALLESHGIDWRGHITPQALINVDHADADDRANSNAESASSSSNTDPKTCPTSTTLTPQQKITLFRSVFHGRHDVYPVRWKKNHKKTGTPGYSPTCHNEWKPGVCGKPEIKCGDCTNQSWKSVTDQVIYDHLAGEHVIGVYPLVSLEDDQPLNLSLDNQSGVQAHLPLGNTPDNPVNVPTGTFTSTPSHTDTGTIKSTTLASDTDTNNITKTHNYNHTTKPKHNREGASGNNTNNKALKYDHCHFLAVDFDEGDWQTDANAFRVSCDQLNIPCSIEISQSGNGAHAWIFFSKPVLAKQARNLGAAIISHASAQYDNHHKAHHQYNQHQPTLKSYDRMFPNQDSVAKSPRATANKRITAGTAATTDPEKSHPSQYAIRSTNPDGNKSAGFGNLIALPLQKHARTQGRSVFVDHNFVPYPDQWAYLASIKPLAVPSDGSGITVSGINASHTFTLRDHIDQLIFQAVGNRDVLDVGHFTLEAFDPNTPWKKDPLSSQANQTHQTPQAQQTHHRPQTLQTPQIHTTDGEPFTTITLTLANLIYIPKADLTPFLTNRLIRIAAFQNPEYYKAQALGFSVWNKPRIICRADNFPHHIGLPRGCLDAVIELFTQHHVRCEIQDERQLGIPINDKAKDAARGDIALPSKVSDSLSGSGGRAGVSGDVSADLSGDNSNKFTANFIGNLRSDQTEAVQAMLAHDQGVLCAPTAFGKTVTAAALIAERGVNTLIIVHRKELLKQWQERLCTFLDINPKQIGIVGSQSKKPARKALERATERITDQAIEDATKNDPTRAKTTPPNTTPTTTPATIIDIAMVQSLIKQDQVNPVVEQYGHVIVDECHHVSAASFEQTLKAIKAKYVLGLTATPIRRDGRQPIIMMQCGPIRHRATRSQKSTTPLTVHAHEIVTPDELGDTTPSSTENGVRSGTANTTASDPSLPIQEVFRQLADNTHRTALIVGQAIEQFRHGRKVLLLTERTDHLLAIEAQLQTRLGNEPPAQRPPEHAPLITSSTASAVATSTASSPASQGDLQSHIPSACADTREDGQCSTTVTKLNTQLNRSDGLFTLHGRLKKSERTGVLQRLESLPADTPRILLATGKLIGEGFDHAPLDTLILAMPISWKGTLQQYVGRLHREHASKTDILVIDFIDQSHASLVRMWNKRQAGYKALEYEIQRIDHRLNHELTTSAITDG